MASKLELKRGRIRQAINKILSDEAKDKIDEIANLKIGENKYLFDITGRDTKDRRVLVDLYNLAFIIDEVGIDEAISYLKNIVIPKSREILLKGGRLEEQNSVLIFNSSLLDKPRHREELVLRLNDDRGALSDMASCGRCGAERVYITSKQTRKADEGATSLFECATCGASWKDKGC